MNCVVAISIGAQRQIVICEVNSISKAELMIMMGFASIGLLDKRSFQRVSWASPEVGSVCSGWGSLADHLRGLKNQKNFISSLYCQ
jgi:hypothetical protein